MTNNDLSFDSLEPIQVPRRLGNKAYIILEASESARVAYQNAGARAARFNSEGNLSGVEGVANIEPLLVSLCLYEADFTDIEDKSTYKLRLNQNGDPDSKYLVPVQVINKWPGRIVGAIFDTIKDISEMEKEDEQSLEKQVAKLQKRLDKLRSNKGIEKKELEDTMLT